MKIRQKAWIGLGVVLILVGVALCRVVLAQETETTPAAPIDISVLRVYFFLLVFATIVNRILQYIKIVLQWFWPKFKFLQAIGNDIWRLVKKNLDKLKLVYDEAKVRQSVDKTAIATGLHTLGFIIGMIICVAFKIGAIDKLGWFHIHPTLNYLLSGILIGAGVDPIHSVFRMVEEKKKTKKLLMNLTSRQAIG